MADKFISKAPIRRIMKGQGANLVAENAVITLVDELIDYGTKLTKKALKIAQNSKRKKVTASDIKLAAKA